MDGSSAENQRLPWDILSIIIEASKDLATLQSWACVCSVANTFAESLLWSHVCMIVEDNPKSLDDPSTVQENDPDILSRPIKMYHDEGLDFHNMYGEDHPLPDIKMEELEFLRGITLEDHGLNFDLGDIPENARLLGNADLPHYVHDSESSSKNETVGIADSKSGTAIKLRYDTFMGELPDEHWGDIDDGCSLYNYRAEDHLEFHRTSAGYLVLDDVHRRKIRPRHLSLLSSSGGGFRKRSHIVTSLVLAEDPHFNSNVPDYLLLRKSLETELTAKGAFTNLRRVKLVGRLRQQGWDRLMCLPALEEVELQRTLDYNYDGWYYPDSYLESRYPLNFNGMERLKRFHLNPIAQEEEKPFCQGLQKCSKLESLVIEQRDWTPHEDGWDPAGDYSLPADSNDCRMGHLFRTLKISGGFPKALREFRYKLKRDCQLARGTPLLYPPYNDPQNPTFSEFFVGAFQANQLQNLHLNVAAGHIDKGLLHIMGTELCFPSLKTLEINLLLNVSTIPMGALTNIGVLQNNESQLLRLRLLREAMALHTNVKVLRITGLQMYDLHALATNLPTFRADRIMYHNCRAGQDDSAIKISCLAYLLSKDPPENREWIRGTKYIGTYARWCKVPQMRYFPSKNGKNAYTSQLRPSIWGIRNLDMPELRIALVNLTGYHKPQGLALSVDPFFKHGPRAEYARLGIALGAKGDDGLAETHARMIAESNPSVRIVALYGYRFWIQRKTPENLSEGDLDDDNNSRKPVIVTWRLREALGDEKMKREVLNWMTDEDWDFLENAEAGQHEVRFERSEGYVDDGEPVRYKRDYANAKCECRLCNMWRSRWRTHDQPVYNSRPDENE